MVDLPHCGLLCNISLEEVGGLYECQQIRYVFCFSHYCLINLAGFIKTYPPFFRSYRSTAIILFAHKSQESSNTLVTVDVMPEQIKLRSIFPCKDVVDVALFTG